MTSSSSSSSGRAIEIDRYGGPSELVWREVSRPPLAAGQVRIRTAFAAVNRADVEIRRGEWPVMQDDPFPYTPGLEVAGFVDAVGAGVSSVAVGDRVITMMQHLGGIWGERPGGYGEFVVVAEETLATIPPDVDLEQIAALGLVAVTASAGLRRLALEPGARVVVHGASGGVGSAGTQRVASDPNARGVVAVTGSAGLERVAFEPGARVVVHGASGGVGSAAVTMAAAAGASVVAVLPRAGKDDYVRSLGATDVVHLDSESLLDAVGPRSVDAALETTGARTFSDSVAVLRRGGRLCLVGALTGADLGFSAWDLLQDLVLTGWSSENLDGAGLRAAMAEIVEHVRDGRLRAPAIERYAMADAAAAHRAMEAGDLRGRALLVP